METNDEETVEKNYELTLDFSKQSLKRVERAQKEHQSATTLMLDYNEIQKLNNMETYQNLKKLSLVGNQLVRMYSVSSLIHLVELDLSQNSLVAIEGLKDMSSLKILKLAGNKIKTIEHLSHNFNLEVLDLGENSIMRISDISHLKSLKELYLHKNKIVNLSHSDKKLPYCLKILTLNDNCINDLNEVSHLSCLTALTELSLANNPCLKFSDNQKLNYRPFVKNWCCNLIVLDGHPLDDIECLKAEWLYSQGRGRSFKIGEHAALIEYLVSVCPEEKEENAETEDVKKLKLILSKAQLHQQQLREQLTSGETSKPSVKRKLSGVPERMVLSFQDSPTKDMKSSSDLMTRSLDSGIVKKSLKVCKTDPNQTLLQTSTSFVPIPDTLISPDVGQPVGLNPAKTPPFSSRTSRSSSRNSPLSTPENKRKTLNTRSSSPVSSRVGEKFNHNKFNAPIDMSGGRSLIGRSYIPFERKANKIGASYKNYRETSEEEDSEALKLKAIQLRLSHRKNKIISSKRSENPEEKENVKEKGYTKTGENVGNVERWKAAVCIQRWWRGYRTRNLNSEVLSGCKSIQMDRIQNYLMKVLSEMETTKIALEGNRKLVVLQMQAINALWKKTTGLAVSSQSDDDKTSIQDLVETCSVLNKQVEALQMMVKNLQSSPKSGSLVPMATQTEIVAIRTPQDETQIIFPFNKNLKYVTSDGISLDSVEDEEREGLNSGSDSINNSTGTTKSQIYSTQDASNKSDLITYDTKTMITCDALELTELSTNSICSITEKLSEMHKKLTKPDDVVYANNDEGLYPPTESKEPVTKSTIESICES